MSLSHHSITSRSLVVYICVSRVLGTPQLCYRWNILFPSRLADLELARVTSTGDEYLFTDQVNVD